MIRTGLLQVRFCQLPGRLPRHRSPQALSASSQSLSPLGAQIWGPSSSFLTLMFSDSKSLSLSNVRCLGLSSVSS